MATKRNITVGTALLFFFVGSAFANITVGVRSSYTMVEDLTITLDENNASIVGRFEFKFSDYRQFFPVHVHLPVWIPTSAGAEQTNLISFLDAISFDNSETIRISDGLSTMVEETIGLSVEANNTRLQFPDMRAYDYQVLLRTSHFPASYWRAGVREVRFIASVDPERIVHRKLLITAEYTQPLIQVDNKTLLFYVPFFNRLTSRDQIADKCRITVRCAEGFELAPRTQLRYQKPPTPTKLVITPQDQQVILVELIKAGQANDPIPLDASWLTEPKWVEKKGEAACKCRGKKDLKLQAIYWAKNRTLVTINNENYQFGDTIRGFTIVQITPTNVVFRCSEGKAVVRELL